MRPVSSTELPALTFNQGQEKQPYHSESAKIGWVRLFAAPGASLNLSIRDGLGRTKFERHGIKVSPDGQAGELINIPTMLGENLEVEVTGLREGQKAEVFLN